MDFQDKTLTCKECGKDFTWTAGEQQFYQEKQLQNPPARCKDCRSARKQSRFGRSDVQFEITCKNCGKQDTVNFKPRDPSSVLCTECFRKERQAGEGLVKEEPAESQVKEESAEEKVKEEVKEKKE